MSDDYFKDHPAEECALWQEWVLVVCRRRQMAPPTAKEWDVLQQAWYHGKAPIESVGELQTLRGAP